VQYAEYTHLTGLLAKDIAALKQGEIHARVNSLLETGRTSCGGSAEDGGYNIQNPARTGGVRECFVPRSGYLLVDADFDGLELRTMAQVCLQLLGESKMAEALNAGLDPHLMLAAQLNDETYEAAKARYEAGDKEARQFSKIGNFGFAGGMGVSTFVQFAANNGVALDEAKARAIKDAWIQTWPEFLRYFQRIAAMTQAGLCQIEQLYSRRWRGGCSYSQAGNTMFQGLGADAAKAAGWAITKACYLPGSVLYGSRVVNFVHDEFLVEVPKDTAAECAAEVGRLMVEAANVWMPDVPAKTTPKITDCWQK
jgi:DNA polymerase I-like protein with 3'-5' exonuclease and polymerase domains